MAGKTHSIKLTAESILDSVRIRTNSGRGGLELTCCPGRALGAPCGKRTRVVQTAPAPGKPKIQNKVDFGSKGGELDNFTIISFENVKQEKVRKNI